MSFAAPIVMSTFFVLRTRISHSQTNLSQWTDSAEIWHTSRGRFLQFWYESCFQSDANRLTYKLLKLAFIYPIGRKFLEMFGSSFT